MTPRVPPPSPGNLALDERLRVALAAERDAALERRCPAPTERRGLRYRLGDREVVSFCSNDYLGLAEERPQTAPQPSGAAASRLVCGDLQVHRDIERRFAGVMGFEDAVLFPSGFQANVGVPASLLQPGDVAYSDALNHASLIDGLRLSSATRRILDHLAAPPRGERAGDSAGARWWFVESVFSMDGDGPASAALDTHLAAGGCVYLDEAHAIGLYANGRGRASQLVHRPTVVVAPLGKAFGCAGAFVCASSLVCDWIRGHARAFVFTTGVSPVLVPRIAHALDQVSGAEGDRRRELLWRNLATLRSILGDRAGLGAHGTQASPILPVLVGDNARALALSAELLQRGWHVQAIRPPTVPEQGARLRITISAAHELDMVERFARDLCELLDRHGLVRGEG
ncbi:aminotransferase class I/II-fold pyridoxal phosphate-dependent enzyme [Enhygromyxa salina]|uniref:8-amino-7-oxononanoate synthase n=1 Tax=Enhygromyxa salina TaxID=215803 RepID=A0A2S9YWE2_9BACT|nr:pyridoxal phosphate-dependent aminotransferase family protein [Enhygromyxa salina]PRQ09404.1 8-amino-7-oxononanoate synthase [Enhygromyxa salina]